MKFKYIGRAGVKSLDLTIAGITKASDVLIPDTIIEVPDDNKLLINKLRVNGNYVEVKEKPKVTVKKTKKDKKQDKKDKTEDKEEE